jgi:xanthine dehydrogenase accessory factor
MSEGGNENVSEGGKASMSEGGKENLSEGGKAEVVSIRDAIISTEDDLLATAERWARAGRGVALASVVETWGSAPRPVGSHLVIDGEGNFLGSVSGGCVEGAVIEEAVGVIETGRGKLLSFGVADETAWRVGLSCGGRISVYVAPLAGALDVLAQVNAARVQRAAVALITDMDSGALSLAQPGAAGLEEAFRSGRSGRQGGGNIFVDVHVPGARLVVIGAVHISQALAEMARLVGLPLTIIDPRTAFATPERFPGVTLLAEWPEDALKQTPLDAYTALVALTHDPKIDDGAIRAALEAGCFYVGALGSRKTHATRCERLADLGPALGRIKAPIGLDIGALSPAEIAVSVLAQVIGEMRKISQ